MQWRRRALLLVDVVESVRLIRRDERGVIERWCAFVEEVSGAVLPVVSGHMVKSLGDGLLMAFDSAGAAVSTAFELHRRIERFNAGQAAELRLELRMGCHIADVAVTSIDVFGDGVNLVQRLASLALPGDTIGSSALCEQLIDGVDVEWHDLGECFVKHLDEPVRAYRLRVPGAADTPQSAPLRHQDFRPGIAVVPFLLSAEDDVPRASGDLIAEGLILHLSVAKHLRVVSRLSSTIFQDRPGQSAAIGRQLGVRYVLSGQIRAAADRLLVLWELAEVDGQSVVETGKAYVRPTELVQPDCPLIADMARIVHDAIFRTETVHARFRPLPNLDSYALLLGGIQLLHRAARADFDRSRALLTHLAELHPRASEPRLWLAKWYALRAVQGHAIDRQADARLALDCTGRALDLEPDNAFALAMEGFVHCHLTQDYERAEHCLKAAILRNPSETFGHLFQAVIYGLKADFEPGIRAAELALATSPLDPARYLFDSIAAYLYLGAGQLEQSIALARRSLRQNCLHAHTWRALTIALVEHGDLDDARECVPHLMDVQPQLTLQTYLAGGQHGDPVRRRFADALGRAGVPVH